MLHNALQNVLFSYLNKLIIYYKLFGRLLSNIKKNFKPFIYVVLKMADGSTETLIRLKLK